MQPLAAQNPTRHKYVIVMLVALGLAIIAIGLYQYLKPKPPVSQPPLTETQQQGIVNGLNEYAKEHPISASDRYQMITGKPMPKTATSTATSHATKK